MIPQSLIRLYSADRNQTSDLLKGFAVLCMIQVHLMELFAKQEIFDSNLGSISLFLGGPPAAPVFMAVMGYYLFLSRKTFVQNLKRGLILIIGGILLNIGLNFHLLTLYLLGKVEIEPLKYILGADILPLAGLSILLISIIKSISRNSFYSNIIISLLILFIILILHNYLLDYNTSNTILAYIQPFFFGSIEWSYFPFLPWAIYPLAGYAFAIIQKQYTLENETITFFVLIVSVITYTTLTFGIKTASDLQVYYHHDWIYSFWIFQFIVLMAYGLDKFEQILGKNSLIIFIKWIGKNVTAVYIFQWLLIGNIGTFLFKTQSALALIVWFVIILFVVTILTYFFERWIKKFVRVAS